MDKELNESHLIMMNMAATHLHEQILSSMISHQINCWHLLSFQTYFTTALL